MPLSYICEFNLKLTGSSAEKYLVKISRQWPALYAELKGVRGTLLLANAFALAGPYSYLWRVDLDSTKTLQVIDDALKSSDREWRAARADWFENRTDVRARLLNIDGDSNYLDYSGKSDGLVHFVLAYGSNSTTKISQSSRTALVKSYSRVKSVFGTQHLSSVVGPSGDSAGELWVRLANLSSLDAVPLAAAAGRRTSLYGELREVNGALIAGA